MRTTKRTTPLPFSSELISSCDVCCKKDMARVLCYSNERTNHFASLYISQLIKNEVFLLLFQVLIVIGHWNLAFYCTESKITSIHCKNIKTKDAVY